MNDYYSSLEIPDIATIAAHELTHHLRLFAETPEEAMGFEEGFCFYAPRKRLLSSGRLAQLHQAEQALIQAHEARLGGHPIWQFGLTDSGTAFTDALFDYWRAIRAVSQLGETYAQGDLSSLLALFDQWRRQDARRSRFDTFLVEALSVSQDDQQAPWLC